MLEDTQLAYKEAEAQLARFERIIKAATVMSEQEKKALAEWEKAHVTGTGDFATSDWPGWEAVINRISH